MRKQSSGLPPERMTKSRTAGAAGKKRVPISMLSWLSSNRQVHPFYALGKLRFRPRPAFDFSAEMETRFLFEEANPPRQASAPEQKSCVIFRFDH